MNYPTKPSLIAAAVATVLGTNAYALTPAQTAASQAFYSGGSSAGIYAVEWAVSQFLTPGTIDVFTDGTGTSTHPNSTHYLIISGTTTASPPAGIPANTNIVEIYRFSGGSFPNGATPEIANTTLPYPTLASIGTASNYTGPAGAKCVTPTLGNSTVTCPSYTFSPTLTNNQVPDWGLTDEEPTLFNFQANLNNLNGGAPVSLAGVLPAPAYVTPFAIGVTANLYANKTNFTRAEVEGILKHTISDWGQLFGDNGARLASGPVFILDRGSGSGTKAAGSQYFLNYPGSNALSGGLTPASDGGAGTAVNTYTGTQLNTAGTALQDINEASNFAIVDDLLAAQAAGVRAIAPSIGAEFAPVLEQASAGTNAYAFAKIHGIGIDSGAGTDNINCATATAGSCKTQYSNIINGSYDFWYQTSFNVHTPSTLAAVNQAIVNAIKVNFTGLNIAGAHAQTLFPASVQGVLLDPNTTKSAAAGTMRVSRGGVSPAPLQLVNDASVAVTIGTDPLN